MNRLAGRLIVTEDQKVTATLEAADQEVPAIIHMKDSRPTHIPETRVMTASKGRTAMLNVIYLVSQTIACQLHRPNSRNISVVPQS